MIPRGILKFEKLDARKTIYVYSIYMWSKDVRSESNPPGRHELSHGPCNRSGCNTASRGTDVLRYRENHSDDRKIIHVIRN